MISVGPTILNAHQTTETLYTDTVGLLIEVVLKTMSTLQKQ